MSAHLRHELIEELKEQATEFRNNPEDQKRLAEILYTQSLVLSDIAEEQSRRRKIIESNIWPFLSNVIAFFALIIAYHRS